MKKIIAIFITLSIVLGLCACTTEQTASDKLQVYTSFYAMYDFTKMIAGDNADVHLLCPPGTEPHDYEPKTTDMARLTEADIFIYNGGSMEHWAQKVASTLDGVSVVCASEGIEGHSHSHEGEHTHDPHVWLDPENALLELKNIYEAIAAADAKNAETYKANYELCEQKIAELDKAYTEAVAGAKTRTIIVAHAAYGYLCEAYGIEQLAIENITGDSDPSPAAMAQIVDTAREVGIKYVCAEEMNSSKVVEAVANEIGAEVVSLNPFEGSKDEKDYFTVMNENLEVLKRILN